MTRDTDTETLRARLEEIETQQESLREERRKIEQELTRKKNAELTTFS